MKNSKTVIIVLCLLVFASAVFRIIPHPWGFTPLFSMAVFGGAMFSNDKKMAFVLPLVSLFVGDVIMQLLYTSHLTIMPGFYQGQWKTYVLFALITTIGFLVNRKTILSEVVSVFCASLAAPTAFFFLSNFMVWAGPDGLRGLNHPRTLDGLILTIQDGLPFYPNNLYSTLLFSVFLFGGYHLVQYTTSGHKLASDKSSSY